VCSGWPGCVVGVVGCALDIHTYYAERSDHEQEERERERERERESRRLFVIGMRIKRTFRKTASKGGFQCAVLQ
jgi:hypothetical protein